VLCVIDEIGAGFCPPLTDREQYIRASGSEVRKGDLVRFKRENLLIVEEEQCPICCGTGRISRPAEKEKSIGQVLEEKQAERKVAAASLVKELKNAGQLGTITKAKICRGARVGQDMTRKCWPFGCGTANTVFDVEWGHPSGQAKCVADHFGGRIYGSGVLYVRPGDLVPTELLVPDLGEYFDATELRGRGG